MLLKARDLNEMKGTGFQVSAADLGIRGGVEMRVAERGQRWRPPQ